MPAPADEADGELHDACAEDAQEEDAQGKEELVSHGQRGDHLCQQVKGVEQLAHGGHFLCVGWWSGAAARRGRRGVRTTITTA
ncbi:hypothetical protein, partial [Streptomyces phytophilus]|uniref:hypothetical protein n=1 Tax=Streptomyces phytophilus TaxID=722715 RepID=UPI001C68EF10